MNQITIHDKPSPFLPGTNIQYAWDSTSIGAAKGCKRYYYYWMILNLRPKKEDSVHLRFGLEYHAALQDYEKFRAKAGASLSHDEALREVVLDLLKRTADWKSDNPHKNRSTLARTVVWYLDHYRPDPAKTYVLEDGAPAVEMNFRFELGWGPNRVQTVNYGEMHTQPYLLCGHLDRVVEFSEDLFVMDRKTTKSQLSSWYFSGFEPDNQMTLYTLAGKVVLEAPIRGVIIDGAQVMPDYSEFKRGLTYRTPDQLDEWLLDLKVLFEEVERCAVENVWPMNDKYCDAYRSELSGSIGCPYRSLCSRSPSTREIFMKSDFVKGEQWNPLIPR